MGGRWDVSSLGGKLQCVPLWGDEGRLPRALPFQHVSLSADQGISTQLEWKYMQENGGFLV